MTDIYYKQDMYQQFLGGEDISNIPKEEDPFWEPADSVLIGTANVFLQSLSYALDFDDKLAVTDYKGQEEGYLWIHLRPCTQAGKPLDEDYFVEDPHELLEKPFHFKVIIIILLLSINVTRWSDHLLAHLNYIHVTLILI